MAMIDPSPPAPSGRIPRMPPGWERLLQVLLGAVLLWMTVYLGFRHYRRFDLTRTAYYSLSDKTHAVLNGLTSRLDILVFIDAERSPVYDDVKNLLAEYENASPKVHVQYISPYKNPARTEQLFSQYGVSLSEDVVVFDYEGRQKYVRDYDLADYDFSDAAFGTGSGRVTAFKGEQAFTSAILALTSPEKQKVHFLTGHGEKSLENFEEKGLSNLAKFLGRENLDPLPLSLAGFESIPRECRLLVIAGPQTTLTDREVSMIRRFLKRNGRLLFLTDPLQKSGLESLLADWDVLVDDDIVVEPVRLLNMEFLTTELNVFRYLPHPITREMGDLVTTFSYVRSVRPRKDGREDADRPTVTALAETSPRAWGERNVREKRARFDEGTDLRGPVSIAVAVELGAIPDVEVDVGSTRAVVFGDSDFISNAMLSQANLTLFLGAVNWLLDREALIAIGPKTPQEYRLVLTPVQLRNVFLGAVLGLPLVVLIFGAWIWWRRRR